MCMCFRTVFRFTIFNSIYESIVIKNCFDLYSYKYKSLLSFPEVVLIHQLNNHRIAKEEENNPNRKLTHTHLHTER